MFAWIFRTFWPKMARVFGGGTGRGDAMLIPQLTRSYFWGLLPLCHFWRKSIKKCDRESADRQTDARCDTEKLNL